MQDIGPLIRRIKIELPDVDIETINLDSIMNLNYDGDLTALYQRDLLLFSFFSVLCRHIKLHLERTKNRMEDLESDIYSRVVNDGTSKQTATDIKRRIQTDEAYRVMRNEITEIEGKHELVESLVDALTKKSIALNVLTARERAEIASGLR